MLREELTFADGNKITYLLERRARRTVGLKITAEGLVVHAPKRIFAFQLNQILQDKSGWIQKKLQARELNRVDAVNWINGEKLLYLGQDITLTIGFNQTNKALFFASNTLFISSPQPDDQTLIRPKVVQWYQKQAALDFGRRLSILAVKLGVTTPPLSLSNAKSRWGSCNSRGEVRLNWRLLQAPPHIINYVICHELAHLKQMNHSAQFWLVVESLFPDYKSAEQELKKLSTQLHRL